MDGSRLMAPPSRRRRRAAAGGIVIAMLAALFTVALSHGDEGGGPPFGYVKGSHDGPESWGKLSPKYRACGEGVEQSPINIVSGNTIPNPGLDTLSRVYAPTTATLVNDGKDITMSFSPVGGQEVGNITIIYNNAPKVLWLKKIHWHAPSEHTVDGNSFPVEAHLVHVNAEGDIAVIGILYKVGEPDPFYDQLVDSLQKLRTSPEVAAGVVDFKSLQKRTGNYFRYMGSLTTPPCTEKVIWNILGKARELSAEQLKLLTLPLPGKDNRPSQPLNSRKVYYYSPPNSSASSVSFLKM